MNIYQEIPVNFEGDRYQRELGDLIVDHRLYTVCETGCGVTTLFILKALDHLGMGALYSIDPEPSFEPPAHRKLERIKGRSDVELPKLRQRIPYVSLFLHDSDHGYECQSFEYDFAWTWVLPGGWIVSDDHEWGGHGAWSQFCQKHNVNPVEIGSARGFKKP